MADPATSTTPRRKRIRAIIHKPGDGAGMQFDKDAVKDWLIIVGLPLFALIAAFWAAARYVKPAPPDTFVMTTGADGGAYHLFAQRYHDFLQREKITITLKPSAGSLENLQRLQDRNAGVDAGLVQAGIIDSNAPTSLKSLGAVYYEPLWIFYRGKEEVDKLSQLAGKPIAIGTEGSGTRALALQLLKASGVAASSAHLLPLGGNEAVKALIAGQVEAALLVASPDAPTVQSLAKAKDVRLASLVQAEAFTRRFTFLSVLHLPRGALDLASDLPARDIRLLATTANLVVKEDFHPALGFLLLQAASEVHRPAGLLQKSGEFPAPREAELPIADEAKRFYQSGTPFLQRYLPFWVANFIERMAVFLVPLIAVLIPLVRFLPMVIEWRAKARVFKWYADLRTLETDAMRISNPSKLDGYFDRLNEIENGVNSTKVANSYSDYVYALRGHIDLVRNRLRKIDEDKTDD